MRRLFSAVFAVCLVIAPARADQPKPVVVPFEMLSKGNFFSGHIVVEVKVNDKGPYRLIFDTGAPTMLVTTKLAKECGLIGEGAAKPAIRPSLMLMPGQVMVGKVQLGGVTATNLPAIVLDHPTVSAIARIFGPIDGIIGFPFFARYRMTIDYQAKQFTFVPNGYKPADVLKTLMTTMLTANRDRTKQSQPRIVAPAAQWGLRVDKTDDDTGAGVDVAEVFPDTAAARAGIRAGDRILTIDGRWTDTVADTFAAVAAVKAGQRVPVRVRRNGEEITVEVTPQVGF